MKYHCSKQTALVLFCIFRQAERSVHFVLSSPTQWLEFVEFYDIKKRNRIAEAISQLRGAGASTTDAPSRGQVAKENFFVAIRQAVRFLYNPLKSKWTFSKNEISFFLCVLDRMLIVLREPKAPQLGDLLELRLDCSISHYIISQKLIGIQAIRQANMIEHFNSSDYLEHTTFEQMEIHGGRKKI